VRQRGDFLGEHLDLRIDLVLLRELQSGFFQMPPRPRNRPRLASLKVMLSFVENVIIIRKNVTSSEIMSQ
jgi:hypothetical protein